MHIHIYMHIHICTQPAANVSQMCTLHAYNCTCTGAQNTCSKVYVTLTTKQCTYVYTYTQTHTHTYLKENTCASVTPSKHTEERLLRLTIYAQICIHIHIHMYIHAYKHVYTCIRIHIHIHMHIYTYIHASTHTYIHIYTHTRTTCAYARMQAHLKRQHCSDCAGSQT